MAAEAPVAVTASELTKALVKWDQDAERNGWDKRTDDAVNADKANYLLHTIRLARGEGQPEPKGA